MIDELTRQLRIHRGVVARLARELLDRIRDLTVSINTLESELRILVRRRVPFPRS
ncbi:hypothetical protein [Frankia sp. CiP3]|uniref:hypothetical protein n=1 Tax=Frankia sp. CiP3 TaxID=2880971 RepID=UPI001EF739A1|nr:hypothetical protein [Frankia sp. CiP3]